MKIMLDPGHGGGRAHNRGFINIQGFNYCNEGDCNFYYATKFLKPALERAGIEVGMTRKNIDDNPSLVQRGRMAKGYDLLISLHSNACGGVGTEVWDSTNPKESIKPLCDRLCMAISQTIGTNNRGTKYRKTTSGSNYYGILRNGLAKHNFIIEHAFHDNYNDCSKYVHALDRVAMATTNVLKEYFNVGQGNNITKETKSNTQTEHNIISSACATAEQVKTWARSKNNNEEFISLVDIYFREFPKVGINPVLGFVQMAHETGFLYKVKSAADINATYHNPCGLKITQGGGDYQASAHKVFKDWTEGIIAHRDHLALYAGINGYPLKDTPDPRHFPYLFGKCKTIESLGGNWAPSKEYGQKLLKYLNEVGVKTMSDGKVSYRNMTICGKDVKAVAVENGVSYLWLSDAKVKVPIREFFETLGMKVDWKDERIIVD
ncbi:N-acetylmuramoyl-L-alanine amidase [Peptoniphilus asaccharolyticus]